MSAVGEFVEFVEAEPPFDPSDFRPRVLACCRLIHLRTHLASLNEEWHPRPSDIKNFTLANMDSTHNPVVLTTSSISATGRTPVLHGSLCTCLRMPICLL